jgi:hypothetical protein
MACAASLWHRRGPARPDAGQGNQPLDLWVDQHLGPGRLHLRIVLGPAQQVRQRAVARPGLVRCQ